MSIFIYINILRKWFQNMHSSLPFSDYLLLYFVISFSPFLFVIPTYKINIVTANELYKITNFKFKIFKRYIKILNLNNRD